MSLQGMSDFYPPMFDPFSYIQFSEFQPHSKQGSLNSEQNLSAHT